AGGVCGKPGEGEWPGLTVAVHTVRDRRAGMIQTLHAFALSASIAGAAVVKTGAFVAAAAVLPLSVPAAAQSAAAALPAASQGLTLEHRMLLKCSAAFALVAHGQSQGQAEALGYTVSAAEG